MTADNSTTSRSTTPNPTLRWSVLGLLLAVVLASLTVSALVVFGNGAGPGVGNRVSSVFDPPADPARDREQAMAAARTFVQRFNTYGPDLLESDGTMPEYAEVGELMSATFRKVFDENVTLAEQTVATTGIDRTGTVYGVGIAAIDADSATLLVGSTVTSSYPSQDDPEERIDFAPQRFRYEVVMVKIDGRWLVDDIDDVDDGLPSLAKSSGDTPGATPSGGASPGATPTTEPSGGATDPATDPATEGSSTP